MELVGTEIVFFVLVGNHTKPYNLKKYTSPYLHNAHALELYTSLCTCYLKLLTIAEVGWIVRYCLKIHSHSKMRCNFKTFLMNLNFGHQYSTSSNWRHFNFTFLSIFFTEFSFNGWLAGGVHCKMEALPTQSNVQLQTRYSTSINGEQKSNWCNSNSLLIRILNHLVHGNASDPAVLLEDFLHISLHYLERVQVPNKNPVKINALKVFRALFFVACQKVHLLLTAWGSWLLVWLPTLLTFIFTSSYFSSFLNPSLLSLCQSWQSLQKSDLLLPDVFCFLVCTELCFLFWWLRKIPWSLFSIYSLCLCFFHENISLVFIFMPCYSKSCTQLPFPVGSVSKKDKCMIGLISV